MASFDHPYFPPTIPWANSNLFCRVNECEISRYSYKLAIISSNLNALIKFKLELFVGIYNWNIHWSNSFFQICTVINSFFVVKFGMCAQKWGGKWFFVCIGFNLLQFKKSSQTFFKKFPYSRHPPCKLLIFFCQLVHLGARVVQFN